MLCLHQLWLEWHERIRTYAGPRGSCWVFVRTPPGLHLVKDKPAVPFLVVIQFSDVFVVQKVHWWCERRQRSLSELEAITQPHGMPTCQTHTAFPGSKQMVLVLTGLPTYGIVRLGNLQAQLSCRCKIYGCKNRSKLRLQ